MKRNSLNNNENNIVEHLQLGPKTHVEITLRSGGLRERQVYLILLDLIDKGIIFKKDGKFWHKTGSNISRAKK